MQKQFNPFIFILIIICLPTSLWAHQVPADSVQTAASKPPKRWSGDILLNIGVDFERTQLIRTSYISAAHRFSFGAGYRFVVHHQLALRPEIWYHQFATPQLNFITQEKSDLDGTRILTIDSLTVLRMAGGNIGLSAEWSLPKGFFLTGGVQCGWYTKGAMERATFSSGINGSIATYRSTNIPDGNKPLPSWFNAFQPGLKIGVEKIFFRRLVLGVNIYQGLTDITNFNEGGKNYSTNFFGYIGVRI